MERLCGAGGAIRKWIGKPPDICKKIVAGEWVPGRRGEAGRVVEVRLQLAWWAGGGRGDGNLLGGARTPGAQEHMHAPIALDVCTRQRR